MSFNLDSRAHIVLKTIVEEFIKHGVPVGSRIVAKKCGLSLSPATIRNIMSDLEDAGFLEQLHVSSGRLPTDTGYRFYVDNFATDFLLREQELNNFKKMCSNFGDHFESLIKKVTVRLSSYSHMVGVVLAPNISDMSFQRIVFVKLSKEKILVIIVSKSGFVSNNVVVDAWNLSQESLECMANIINSKLIGSRFSEYRRVLLRMMEEEKNQYQQLLSRAMKLGTMALENSTTSKIFVEGQLQIVSHPDFSGGEKIKEIFEAFEEKSRLLNILDKCVSTKGVQIFIGSENKEIGMPDYSLVLSKYAVNKKAVGTLGVIGPKRMEYSRVIPLVSSAADVLSKIE